MLRDDADAEDAVQDTFMRAFLAIARYDDRQPFRAWLFSILVNRCRTLALQRTRRSRRFPHDELALVNATAPELPASGREDAVRTAVDDLEPLLREADEIIGTLESLAPMASGDEEVEETPADAAP
jgi:RNA polymerase sigma-70 factor (ECF subfamily)